MPNVGVRLHGPSLNPDPFHHAGRRDLEPAHHSEADLRGRDQPADHGLPAHLSLIPLSALRSLGEPTPAVGQIRVVPHLRKLPILGSQFPGETERLQTREMKDSMSLRATGQVSFLQVPGSSLVFLDERLDLWASCKCQDCRRLHKTNPPSPYDFGRISRTFQPTSGQRLTEDRAVAQTPWSDSGLAADATSPIARNCHETTEVQSCLRRRASMSHGNHVKALPGAASSEQRSHR